MNCTIFTFYNFAIVVQRFNVDYRNITSSYSGINITQKIEKEASTSKVKVELKLTGNLRYKMLLYRKLTGT